MKTESFPKMHVSLYVKDIEETANFYTKFFGKDVEKMRPGYVKFHLKIRH
jgi:catechol 2,3-dioxygenase-like lactoylglutathione lyase family enzyme